MSPSSTTSSTSPPSCADRPLRLAQAPVLAWWTTRAHGDQRGAGSTALRRRLPAGGRVFGLRQLHGAGVVVEPADADVEDPAGDALVSARPGRVLLVRTADCAAVALGSPEGVFGAVHAGWRGLEGQVVERAVHAMGTLGASEVVAGLGPCIGPCCYAFGDQELDTLARRYGEVVRGRTRRGEDALDLPAAVRGALVAAGAILVHDGAVCTGCTADTWSHRMRGDVERQALAVWRDPES